MLLAFSPGVIPFSGHIVRIRREIFPVLGFAMNTNKSNLTIGFDLTTTDLMGKIEEKFKGKDGIFPAAESMEVTDIPSHLCIIDTLQRLGVDRFFKSEIDFILEETYMLWQQREKIIFSDIALHAMAFRLLRVKGYEVSSEELAPYDEQERVNLHENDVTTVIELYRAAQERIYEEETSLQKLLAWTTSFLKQQLLSNSIHDKKLHKLVEYYLKNYHGILNRQGVRQNLDLYDINHYQTLVSGRFSNLCNEDILAFARHDFNNCQALHQKELEQLQRWYADCRLDKLNFGRDVVRMSNFITSAMMGDPELSNVRLAFAKHIVLVTRFDDFFDHAGSREDSNKLLELVTEWKEKPTGEYGSEEVEILFTAVYNTVNEFAEMAHAEQGQSVREFFIKVWIEMLCSFKVELDKMSEDTTLSMDEYLSIARVSIGCDVCILMSIPFVGAKLSDEMLLSEECSDMCRHVSMVNRLLNDVQTFEKERKENDKGNSLSILLATGEDGRALTEEECIIKVREMAEYHRRKLMQIVYKRGTIFPRECKHVFLEACKTGCYLYSTTDEFTSPQQVKEDMKSLIYQPLTLLPNNTHTQL